MQRLRAVAFLATCPWLAFLLCPVPHSECTHCSSVQYEVTKMNLSSPAKKHCPVYLHLLSLPMSFLPVFDTYQPYLPMSFLPVIDTYHPYLPVSFLPIFVLTNHTYQCHFCLYFLLPNHTCQCHFCLYFLLTNHTCQCHFCLYFVLTNHTCQCHFCSIHDPLQPA